MINALWCTPNDTPATVVAKANAGNITHLNLKIGNWATSSAGVPTGITKEFSDGVVQAWVVAAKAVDPTIKIFAWVYSKSSLGAPAVDLNIDSSTNRSTLVSLAVGYVNVIGLDGFCDDIETYSGSTSNLAVLWNAIGNQAHVQGKMFSCMGQIRSGYDYQNLYPNLSSADIDVVHPMLYASESLPAATIKTYMNYVLTNCACKISLGLMVKKQESIEGLYVSGRYLKNIHGDIIKMDGYVIEANRWVINGTRIAEQVAYAKAMGATSIRVAVAFGDIEAGWLTNATWWTNVKYLITQAAAQNLVVLIDAGVHWSSRSDCFAHYVNDYFDGDVYSWADWVNWWAIFATQLSAYGNVIFQLCGEPMNVSAADWVTHCRAAIDAIRAIDADRIVMVDAMLTDIGTGGRWVGSFAFELDIGLQRSNVMFGYDAYGFATGTNTETAIRAALAETRANEMIAANKCVVIPEFNGVMSGSNWTEVFGSWQQTWQNNLINVLRADGYQGAYLWSFNTYPNYSYEQRISAWFACSDYYGTKTANGTWCQGKFTPVFTLFSAQLAAIDEQLAAHGPYSNFSGCCLWKYEVVASADWTTWNSWPTKNGSGTTYDLTMYGVTGGTTTPAAGVSSWAAGQQVTLTAYPDTQNGYHFVEWLINSVHITANPYSFNLNANTSVTPVFSSQQFKLTMYSGVGGTTTPAAGESYYDYNAEITLTAYPDTANGYTFKNWVVNGVLIYGNPYVFNLTTATTVTPVFSPSMNPDVTGSKMAVALGTIGVPQSDIIEASVHLGATKEVSSWSLRLDNSTGKYSANGAYPLHVGHDGYICIGRTPNVPQLITTRTEKLKFHSTPTENDVVVSGRCWGEKLFRQKVTKDYSGFKGEAIVKNLLDYYSGISHVRGSIELVEDTDTTFADLKVKDIDVWELIQKVAAESDKNGVIGYDFRVAPDGKLEFFATGSKVSPVSIVDRIEDYDYQQDIFAIRNKITIYGAADKSTPLDKDQTVESLTPASGNWSAYIGTLSLDAAVKFGTANSSIKNATGANYAGSSLFTFGAAVNLNTYPKVVVALMRDANIKGDGFDVLLYDTLGRGAIQTVPGVNENEWSAFELSVGAEYSAQWNAVANFDWTQVIAVRINGWLVAPATPGNIWMGQLYFGGARYSSVQQDVASQAAFGVREFVDTDEELWSDADCELRAKAVLEKMQDIAEYIRLTSTVIDFGATPLFAGDLIPVSLPVENVSGNFRIISVEYSVKKDTGELEITLELGREKALLADYVYALRSKVNHVNRYKVAR